MKQVRLDRPPRVRACLAPITLALALACQPSAPPADAETPASDSPDAKPEVKGSSGSLLSGLFSREPEAEPALTFEEPGPGPRAPITAAFHVELGETDLAGVEATVQRLGLRCGDTSIRAQMKKMRETKMAEAKARGEDVVTSASWAKPSKREKNPQVRYSCGRVAASQLGDRERPTSSGRLLYVFDSEQHPVRHASYQRTHKDQALALADVKEAVESATKLYGPPTRVRNALPEPAGDGAVEFPLLKNIEFEWEYSDLLVKIVALRLDETKVTVGERVEVPTGVRPDAPTLPRTPGDDAPESAHAHA
ncbi:MAG: hypothetical protein KC468_24760, partial [Myxococcales bacterium]|nr:hypothetical protein [Myxococcales bacterium]